MLIQFKKHLSLFWAVQSAGIAKDIQLRGNFTTTLIGSLCYFYLHLISFKLIISRFRFPGWETGQLWILLFTFEIFTYLAFFFFWRGLQHTPKEIRTGSFDILLSKPFSSRFLAFFRNCSLHNLVSAMFGAIYLVFALVQYQIHTTPIGIILYLLTLTTSLWIFHWSTAHNWCRTRRLKAEHLGASRRFAEFVVLAEPAPVRGDVARVANRQSKNVRRVAERVHDFKRAGLLPFDAVRIHGIDERD